MNPQLVPPPLPPRKANSKKLMRSQETEVISSTMCENEGGAKNHPNESEDNNQDGRQLHSPLSCDGDRSPGRSPGLQRSLHGMVFNGAGEKRKKLSPWLKAPRV
uniref:Uncharacterized protein n=1 Tax=Micrurus corallinus TaxID=54390 RepID=A0A2D4EZI6_MICCO